MDGVTLAIAIWGAITGTAGLILAVAEYRRDRPVLRVSVAIGRLTEANGWSEPQLFVEAVNAGRRQIEVVGAGLALEAGTDRLFFTGNPGYYKTPALLAEGETHKTWAPLGHIASEVARLDQGLPSRAFYRSSIGKDYFVEVPEAVRDEISGSIQKMREPRSI